MSKLSLVAATALLLARPVAAQTTTYSTFGAGDSYNINVGWTVGQFPQWVAAPFTFGGSSGDLLFDFRVALMYDADITASFWAGSDMNTATQLESWNVSAISGLNTFTSVLNPALTNGETYWVMLAGPMDELTAWNWNSQGHTGPFKLSRDLGESWLPPNAPPTPAFDVSVTSADSTVPEPATMTLLATGLAGIAAARRRK